MDTDCGIEDGREATGGIGPPGSISRRRLLQGAAAAGVSLGAIQLNAAGAAAATQRPSRGRALRLRSVGASRQASPPVNGLHLQFGADASNEVVVTWQTYAAVKSPRVHLGARARAASVARRRKHQGLCGPKEPDERVFVHSARLRGLPLDREYFCGHA